MHLRTSRKVLESEIRAMLIGRILGIVYWIISIACLVNESQIVVEYYFKYFLSQDASHTVQIQVVEIILCYLAVVAITIFFALDAIVSLSITFRQEKSLLKPHICTSCQKKKWRRINLNQAVRAGSAWLKGHVKECPPAKPKLQTIEVKTVFLNLEKDKNKNKTDTTTTKKDQ